MHPFFAPHFRKPAGLFGLVASNFMVKHNGFVYAGIERHAGFEDGQAVLEIGYGPGEGLDYLLGRHGIRIDGVDFSPLMYRKAKRKNRKPIKDGRLRLFMGDFMDGSLPLGEYDRVIFANLLYFWDDLDAGFARIRSLLKRGGKLAFYMSSKARLERNPLTSSGVFNRYDSAEVVASLLRAGYANVREHRIQDDSGDFLIIGADA